MYLLVNVDFRDPEIHNTPEGFSIPESIIPDSVRSEVCSKGSTKLNNLEVPVSIILHFLIFLAF